MVIWLGISNLVLKLIHLLTFRLSEEVDKVIRWIIKELLVLGNLHLQRKIHCSHLAYKCIYTILSLITKRQRLHLNPRLPPLGSQPQNLTIQYHILEASRTTLPPTLRIKKFLLVVRPPTAQCLSQLLTITKPLSLQVSLPRTTTCNNFKSLRRRLSRARSTLSRARSFSTIRSTKRPSRRFKRP